VSDLLRPLIIVIGLSLLLTFVYQKSHVIDTASWKSAQYLLTKIEAQEHMLERDMLKIHDGNINHFDSLKYARKAILKDMQLLQEMLPEHMTKHYATLQQSIGQQSTALEHFMTNQAVLTNSLRFLPKAIALAIEAEPQRASHLYALHRDILHYLRTLDQTDAEHIQQNLMALAAHQSIRRHAEHVFQRNQRVFGAMHDFHAAGVFKQIALIGQELENYLEVSVSDLQRYQLWLMILALVLIAYIAWVVWRQTHIADDLRRALSKVDAQQSVLDEHAIVSIADQYGNITFANDKFCKISGYSREELLGQNHRIVNSAHHNKAFFKNMWQSIAQGQAWNGVIRNQNKAGHYYWVDATIVPFLDEAGKPYQYVSIHTDITRLIEQEDAERLHRKKLEHAQRLESLGVLAGGIAHDFNNLLTAIMGNAGLVDRTLEAGSPSKDKIQRVIKASEKAASLCKQMLAYSGKGHFIVQACDMSVLAQEMMELLQVSIDKNVVIKYELSEKLPSIEADVSQMHQVIMNLVTNANEAIEGHSGVITLSTGWLHADSQYLNALDGEENLATGDYVYMEVSDNGCGMDDKTIDKIFDPFYSTKLTGRGLGMSALHGIVRGHFGAIKVYSELGRGTTIKILFPVAEHASAPQDAAVKNRQLWHADGGVALIVDDEEMIRELAGVMLRDMGFEVLTAANGLEAVELYPEHKDAIKLVLLDMSMPKMDGEQTFRELRKMNPDVCVILSSGYNEQEATERFKGKGLAGFVHKPYLPDVLEKAVAKALES